MTHAEWLAREFVRVWPYLEKAVERGAGAADQQSLWESIVIGEAQLWPTQNAVLVTEIRNHPTGQKVLVACFAGGDLAELTELAPKVEDWGREQGCHRAQIVGRKGWERIFKGYRHMATVIGKEL